MSGVLLDEVIVESVHRPGQLRRMLLALARERVDVYGLSAYLTEGTAKPHRAVRFLLTDPNEGAAALKREGFTVKVAPVLVLPRPTILFELELALGRLVDAGLTPEAVYTVEGPEGAAIAIATDSAEKAAEVLGDVVRLAQPGPRPMGPTGLPRGSRIGQ